MGVKDGGRGDAGDKRLSEWPSPGAGGRQGHVFFNPARGQRPTPLTGRHAGQPLFVLCHVRDVGSPGVMTGHAALFMQNQPVPPGHIQGRGRPTFLCFVCFVFLTAALSSEVLWQCNDIIEFLSVHIFSVSK